MILFRVDLEFVAVVAVVAGNMAIVGLLQVSFKLSENEKGSRVVVLTKLITLSHSEFPFSIEQLVNPKSPVVQLHVDVKIS